MGSMHHVRVGRLPGKLDGCCGDTGTAVMTVRRARTGDVLVVLADDRGVVIGAVDTVFTPAAAVGVVRVAAVGDDTVATALCEASRREAALSVRGRTP